MMDQKIKVGFIGQGFVGKSYADDFEARGLSVVRYSIEPQYIQNKDLIQNCDIVFIAVPTPTTKDGFDLRIVKEGLQLVGKGKTAVIKSTVLPGTTKMLQEEFPEIMILMSPEFLTASVAAFDAAHPKRTIIGIPKDTEEFRKKAEEVLQISADSPYKKICGSNEAELIKYGRNVLGYFRVIFTNLLYDLSGKFDANWEDIREAMSADPDNGPTYMNPVHRTGRGAGGACFIKDFAAFKDLYREMLHDERGVELLTALEEKNIELLLSTSKDLPLLTGVYGEEKLKEFKLP